MKRLTNENSRVSPTPADLREGVYDLFGLCEGNEELGRGPEFRLKRLQSPTHCVQLCVQLVFLLTLSAQNASSRILDAVSSTSVSLRSASSCTPRSIHAPYSPSPISTIDDRFPPELYNSTSNQAQVQKRHRKPTYDEAYYIWWEESRKAWGVAEKGDQFEQADKAAGWLTLSNLDNGGKTEGAFGEIYQAILKDPQNNGEANAKSIGKVVKGRAGVDEAKIQKSIDSLYVAKVKHTFWSPKEGKAVIMMDELNLNLEEELNDVVDNEAEFTATRPIQQMFRAVADVHAAGVAHRDIKPENVMYWSECGGQPEGGYQPIDFGHATKVQNNQNLPKFGTELYMAPGK